MQWLTNLHCFFADVCTWGAEPGSPFETHAPAAVPLERHWGTRRLTPSARSTSTITAPPASITRPRRSGRSFRPAAGCATWELTCALPTGEHCAPGLVGLGCGHAQAKKSATPIFRRMLHSHQRSLTAARSGGEPAGQVAARELEVIRIQSALRRTEELAGDVAEAIESAA